MAREASSRELVSEINSSGEEALLYQRVHSLFDGCSGGGGGEGLLHHLLKLISSS